MKKSENLAVSHICE